MLNLHLLECTVKGNDHISDLLLAKYWVITGCKYCGCTSLTSIAIPNGVTEIGDSSFHNCKLSKVYCKPTAPPKIYNTTFGVVDYKIYVPTASVEAYTAANVWNCYADNIEGYDFWKKYLLTIINEKEHISEERYAL